MGEVRSFKSPGLTFNEWDSSSEESDNDSELFNRKQFKIRILNEIYEKGGKKEDAKKESIWETGIKDRDLINLVDKAMVWQDECNESSDETDEEGEMKNEIIDLQDKLQEYEKMVKDLQLKFIAAVDVIEEKE